MRVVTQRLPPHTGEEYCVTTLKTVVKETIVILVWLNACLSKPLPYFGSKYLGSRSVLSVSFTGICSPKSHFTLT